MTTATEVSKARVRQFKMGEFRKTNNAGGNPRISQAKTQRRLCEAAIALTQNLRNL